MSSGERTPSRGRRGNGSLPVRARPSDDVALLEPKTAKGRRSRDILLASARKVFAEHGYTNTPVGDVAIDAGFSLGAFYRYFHDKRDVLMTLLDRLFSDMLRFSRAPWEPGDPSHSVIVTTQRYLNLYRDNADLLGIMMEASHTEPSVLSAWMEARREFYKRIERTLTRGQLQGVVRSDIDPAVVAALLGGMTEHYAYLAYVVKAVPNDDVEFISLQVSLVWADGTSAAKSAV